MCIYVYSYHIINLHSKNEDHGPITSWQIDEGTMGTVTDFILGSSKITASGDCSHEIKDTCSLKEKLGPT